VFKISPALHKPTPVGLEGGPQSVFLHRGYTSLYCEFLKLRAAFFLERSKRMDLRKLVWNCNNIGSTEPNTESTSPPVVEFEMVEFLRENGINFGQKTRLLLKEIYEQNKK
jgi:hypothetical protein